ncbi:MAG TPA: hypothetical protein DCY88_07905 [Cyanobacteria bacterium UBA11372]|nr:hypothetical protein [Cyanobacteria bacterium UBA11372]
MTNNLDKKLMGRMEISLSKAIAELHFSLKVAEKIGNTQLAKKLQKQHGRLVSIAQQVSLCLDELASREKLDLEQLFSVDDVVQVIEPYTSYHKWIGRVVSVNIRNEEVVVAFRGSSATKTFKFASLTKAWKSAVPRLTMKV